ncbi:hypothetical protein QBC32DRAFT_67972 [Pseudoneurospora amorphoporcata]|uniref:Conidiation-specific protein 8 n=1 Tax=Pseudoneurospora amorphoporcata TaxID=241081 RepID=A0AAN6NZL3_9PEZI|nr:hypothetical protein QBC32DRAFT_67972 [Pseudoneurospora amorphoporcata]
MDDTITTGGTTTTVGPLPPTTSTTAPPASGSVAPVSGDARTSIAAQATAAANRRRTPGSSSTDKTGGATKTGTDPAQSMSWTGTGARDTSESKLIDDSTKLFPSSSGQMGGMGTMAGEGEGNVFRNERSASMSSSSSTGSDRLMGSASTVTEFPRFPHHRRASHALFEGLTAQKRRNDPESVARRKSLSEQRPPSGFIAKMWDNWVRGVPPDI